MPRSRPRQITADLLANSTHGRQAHDASPAMVAAQPAAASTSPCRLTAVQTLGLRSARDPQVTPLANRSAACDDPAAPHDLCDQVQACQLKVFFHADAFAASWADTAGNATLRRQKAAPDR
jgi:hypothetical protein